MSRRGVVLALSSEGVFMRLSALVVVAGLMSAAPTIIRGAGPTTQPEVLSSDVRTALDRLSAEDFEVRQKAMGELKQALGRQLQAIMAPGGAESQERVKLLLEFNEGLSRWVLQTMELPKEQRQTLLAFGLRPEMLPIVANLAATDPAKRIEGVRALARVKAPLASDLLAPLLEDPDRAVYVAAMEVAWDRPPSAAVVDGLWERAVEAGFAIYNPVHGPQEEVRFRGEPLGPTFFDNAAYRHMQDSNVACEVLIHLHAPEVKQRLAVFFQKMDEALTNPNPRERRAWMYGPNSAPMKNVYALLEAYQPKEALGSLYHLATGPMRQPFNGQINNRHYFWSNRTEPLAMLLKLTDQQPTDYKLKQLAQPAGMWAFPTEGDEEAAVKRLRTWWEAYNGAATEPGK